MDDTFNLSEVPTSQYSNIKKTTFDNSLDSFMDYGARSAPNNQDMYLSERQDLYHLEFWDKLGLMAIGTTVVCVTLCIVVCTVGPGCFIYNCIKKSAKSTAFEKKCSTNQNDKDGTTQRGKEVFDRKGSLAKTATTFEQLERKRFEKLSKYSPKSKELFKPAPSNGVKGHVKEDITSHNGYQSQEDIVSAGTESTNLNGITFGYGTRGEIQDSCERDQSSEDILPDLQKHDEEEDVGSLVSHKELRRGSSTESTASFWSTMSVTNAISNISSSLSRVLSAKDRERSDGSRESGIRKDRFSGSKSSTSRLDDSTSSMVELHTSDSTKRRHTSAKAGSSKILLSFQLTRKNDSSVETDTDTHTNVVSDSNTEFQGQQKIQFTENLLPTAYSGETSSAPTYESSNIAFLTIKIESVDDLPPREYSTTRDPFVKLTLVKDTRRSLRKKTHLLLEEFKTKTVRHSLHPEFNETFTSEIKMSEFKNIRLKISIFDLDRHTKTTEITTTTIPLKDIKLLVISEEPVQLIQSMSEVKHECGEILFGLTYLPTAQRLSFSIVKATNLKYNMVVDKIDEFRPYIRILQVSSKNGKVIRKKKTAVKAGTVEPEFNETLHFDLQPQHVERMIFIVMISHRSIPEEQLTDVDLESASDSTETLSSSYPLGMTGMRTRDEFTYITPRELQIEEANRQHSSREDVCLGTVCLGQNVQGEKAKTQFLSVLMAPRKVLSVWHTIY